MERVSEEVRLTQGHKGRSGVQGLQTPWEECSGMNKQVVPTLLKQKHD